MLKGAELELACAPAGLWRWKEIVVLLEPKIEVSIRIEAQDRSPKIPFEATKVLVNFRQLLARVRKEVLDVDFRVLLSHVDGKRCAVASA